LVSIFVIFVQFGPYDQIEFLYQSYNDVNFNILYKNI